MSGILLIAGTVIGAGMLGIPLVTAKAGFFPAIGITAAVWLFMLATGFLYLEATLWMHDGANVFSMAHRFLGRQGRWIAGAVYLFLYGCLMVAYFAAGAPILSSFLGFGNPLTSYLFYGLFFGGIVLFGLKMVDRVNYILMAAMLFSYFALVSIGAPYVSYERLVWVDWPETLFAAPILFSAFGFHNVIPSLTVYFKRDASLLRSAIFWGTFIPFAIYVLWQWMMIGAVPPEAIQEASLAGKPATAALQTFSDSPGILRAGRFFAFFAIVTSMLGVSFSMVDFLADGTGLKGNRFFDRLFLCALVFIPPFLFAWTYPAIFVSAIGFAGGFGEAFLNGCLPVAMVWAGRYRDKLGGRRQLFGNRLMLSFLFLCSLSVILLEAI